MTPDTLVGVGSITKWGTYLGLLPLQERGVRSANDRSSATPAAPAAVRPAGTDLSPDDL
jgi:hypothetical protein